MVKCSDTQLNPAQPVIPSEALPAVTGTVHCEECLTMLSRLQPGAVDFLELRADAFLPDPGPALEQVKSTGIPWIFTLRDSSEGGQCSMTGREKIPVLEKYSTGAAWIDLELATAKNEPALIAALRSLSVPLILSHHDFERMPAAGALAEMCREAADLGSGIFKAAAYVASPGSLHPLFRLLEDPPVPVSVMGMGPMGRASRLALAIAGSALNYGYLGAPNAPGQWFAPDLKSALRNALAPEDSAASQVPQAS